MFLKQLFQVRSDGTLLERQQQLLGEGRRRGGGRRRAGRTVNTDILAARAFAGTNDVRWAEVRDRASEQQEARHCRQEGGAGTGAGAEAIRGGDHGWPGTVAALAVLEAELLSPGQQGAAAPVADT